MRNNTPQIEWNRLERFGFLQGFFRETEVKGFPLQFSVSIQDIRQFQRLQWCRGTEEASKEFTSPLPALRFEPDPIDRLQGLIFRRENESEAKHSKRLNSHFISK